ncbi:MAG: reverse transcriptase domain-containing protein, partial [Gaiellaceae bacterium]
MQVLDPEQVGPPLADEWLDDEALEQRRAQRENQPSLQRELLPLRLETEGGGTRQSTVVGNAPIGAIRNLSDDLEREADAMLEGDQAISPGSTGGGTPGEGVGQGESRSPEREAIIEREAKPLPVFPRRLGSQRTEERRVSFVDPPAPGQREVEAQQQPRTTRSGRTVRAPSRLSPEPSKKRYDSTSFFSPRSTLLEAFAYFEELLRDPVNDLLDTIHPMAYGAKPRNEDTPRYHEAMSGPYAEEFLLAMKNEITELAGKKTWEVVERPPSVQVLPGTWSYKVKRYPDGRVKKFKARFCVRGDRQTEGINCFDMYAPVVSWSTVRLMMTLSMLMGLKSRQVDYNNAFAQAKLKQPV